MSKNDIGGGKPIRKMEDLSPIERRVIEYLDQRGNSPRDRMVCDLVSPDSRIGRGHVNGSNAFMPAIAARWTKRLTENGLVRDQRDDEGFHRHYSITNEGARFVRGLR